MRRQFIKKLLKEECKMVNLNRKKYVRLLIIALVICFISMAGASLVNSDFGKIKVQNFSIEDANGNLISCIMYKPSNATEETPAPCVVTLHGSFDAKETQDYTCLELAKRGYVAITMDCDGHGDSENYKTNPMDAFFKVTANPGSNFEDISTSPGSGMCDVVNYVYNSLSFVDKDQIGITGHSLGGKMANACLAYNKIQEENGGVNQIAAVFLMGNQQLAVDNEWLDHLNYDPDDTPDSGDEIPLYYDVDFGVNAGQLDENNYQTEAGGPSTFNKSKNARTFINELDNYNLQEGDEVEEGKIYSGTVQDSDEEYIRVLYQPYETHILNHYSLATTSNLVDFFQNAFEAPNYIDSGSLTIQYKWFFNTIGVVGFFLVVFAAGCLLLGTKFYGGLVAQQESDVFVPAAPKGVKNQIIYWVFLLAGAAIPAMFMLKLEQWIGSRLGPDFATRSLFGTKIWPQGLTLEQGMWTAAAGLVGIGLFVLGYYLTGKKAGVKPGQWNLKISGKNFAKTLLLVISAIGAGYAVVVFAKYFFNVDFRFISYVIKVPSSDDLLVALRFMPLFAIFFFANALCQNLSNMVAGRKEWLNTLLMCLFNIIGLAGIWIYQYSGLIADGVVRLDSSRVMLSWPLFINLCLCTVLSRRFYKKTGKIYMGALMNTILFTIISCANTMTLVCTNWWF